LPFLSLLVPLDFIAGELNGVAVPLSTVGVT
jgi:hypothetical protein